ncbi:MAG TPA: hypothetical protein PLV61_08995 [Parvularculaceae bacterium]|nr:hypothetical protein [Caulobacterales bacterium]HPE31318.1 hypothetical protein [Parvularculaceae bacterium]HRX39028.1 hypothetical protein [Parvularculaceae bacterium]
MGVVVRLLAFLVGVLAFGFVGLDTAQDHFGVDAAGLLAKMGEMPGGIATSALSMVDGGLDKLGVMMAGLQGGEVDPEKPGLVQSWGPQGLSALVSALVVMFSLRR